jgi:hypothetical protein
MTAMTLMTGSEHTRNSPSRITMIGMGKSAANDAHDGDDDELQRFSKGVATLFLEMRDGARAETWGA